MASVIGAQEARPFITKLAKELADAGIENARRDANLILQMAMASDEPILMHHEIVIDAQIEARLAELMGRRMAGCPISRLRGTREFYSLNFQINDATLDPRPDSEVLVEAAIGHIGAGSAQVADFGTGSGCLLIATLAHCPQAKGVGLDISADAIAQARINAAAHDVAGRAQFLVSDWDKALDEKAEGEGQSFDVILSNPPYIPMGDAQKLAREVALYDPALALYGGESGLEVYEIVMDLIAKRLAKGGVAFVEIGQGQETDVGRLGQVAGMVLLDQLADLSGIIRCLKFQK